MKAELKDWISATANLRVRQKERGILEDNRQLENVLRDYRLHLMKCNVGESVLDVGCGGQFLKEKLPDNVKQYIGIDAFPIDGIETIKMAIEDDEALQFSVDSVCFMAILDNCLDFNKAITNAKKIAKKNIIILTGINIEVDKFHTFKLQLEDYDSRFEDWENTHREELQPKVWLLCYSRK